MTKPEAGMSPLEQRARHWARNLNPGENVSDDVVELRVRHYLAGARAEVEAYRERVLARLIAMDANQLPWFEDVGRILEEEK